MPGVITRRELTDDENRVLRATCLLAGLALIVPASYTYLLLPMLADLGASGTQGSLLRAVPSIGSLLVIFPAGVLGRKVGQRRLLVGTGVCILVGSVVVAAAPIVPVVTVGMVLLSVGRSALLIVVIALLTQATTRKDARPVAFSVYGTVDSGVFVAAPVLAGLLVTVASWRVVAALWALSGLGLVVVALRLLPRDDERRSGGGELWTPALAGLVLTCLVQAAYGVHDGHVVTTAAVVWAAAAAAAAVLLALLLRRLPHPTLSLDGLRDTGLTLLLMVVLLIPFANLWFYSNALFQYVYGTSALTAAFLAAPAQVASVAGAAAVKGFIQTKGITVAGTTLLVGAAAMLFLSCFHTVSTPIVVPVVVLCLYGAAVAGAEVGLSTSVMDRAASGAEGAVSSLRSAAYNLGGALGVIFMSTVVSVGVHRAYAARSTGDLDRSQLQEVLVALHNGETTQDVAARFAVAETDVEELTKAEGEAIVIGYRSHGFGGGLVTLGAAGVFYVSRRRYAED